MKNWLLNFRKQHEIFISYFLWGLVGTAINMIGYAVLKKILPFPYPITNALVWVITVLFGYYTNRHFVFKSKPEKWTHVLLQAFRFLEFRILSGVADSVVMIVCTSFFGWPETWGKLLANIAAALINYFTSKQVVFKERKPHLND